MHELIAGHVVGVSSHYFLLFTHLLISRRHFVKGDLVVQATARHKASCRRIRAGHHPSGWHCNHMLFGRTKRVPYNQFTILFNQEIVVRNIYLN